MLVEELQQQAQRDAYSQLGAFTHAPEYFAKLGFSVVPHSWLPARISMNGSGYSRGGSCGRFAMVMSLEAAFAAMEHRAPATSPHIWL
jgi:N-acetylglutamate synthase-like GNAT family acetyltransferase